MATKKRSKTKKAKLRQPRVKTSVAEQAQTIAALRQQLANAGVTPEQIGAALDPAGYLGAARQFTGAALAAHAQYAEHAG